MQPAYKLEIVTKSDTASESGAKPKVGPVPNFLSNPEPESAPVKAHTRIYIVLSLVLGLLVASLYMLLTSSPRQPIPVVPTPTLAAPAPVKEAPRFVYAEPAKPVAPMSDRQELIQILTKE